MIKSSIVEYGSRKNSGVVQEIFRAHPGETIGYGSSLFLWTVTDGLQDVSSGLEENLLRFGHHLKCACYLCALCVGAARL